MPLQKCQANGKTGWRWGEQGKCYIGPNGKALALRQARAIKAGGYTGNLGLEAVRKAPRPLKRVVNKGRRDPIRADPSRTALLRRKFIADLRRRMNRLSKSIRKLVVDEDIFGLNEPTGDPKKIFNVFCPTGKGGGIDPTCGKGGTRKGLRVRKDGTASFNGTLYRGGEIREDPSGTFGKGYYFTSEKSVADAYALPYEANVISFEVSVEGLFPAKDYDDVISPVRKSLGKSASTAEMAEAIKIHYQSKGYSGIAISEHLISDSDTIVLFDPPTFVQNISNQQEWRFLTSQQKLNAFLRWLKTQLDKELLETDTPEGDHYWEKYVEEGFRKGAGRAFDEVKKSELQKNLDFYEGTKSQFLRSSFGQPESVEKVKLLAARTFTDLEGISQSMSTRMSRVLVDGLVQGKNPRDVAKDLTKEVDVSRSRAETIARTEIIRAHAEGALQAMEELGVEEIGVMVEWDTAGDGRVCPLCQELDGIVLKIEEAHGLIPRHPNCRCTPIPANLGEDTEEQIRGKASIQAAIRRSVKKEKKSTWAGQSKQIDKNRPESLI